MRIMAIDYGDARTGIAISDALGMLTGTTTVIHSWNAEITAQAIVRLVRENGVERIVMGFPRNMDGTEGPRADLYREFAAKLEELLGEKIVLWDQRRTTKTTTTGKSRKTQSMPWRRRSFWRATSAIFAHTRSNRTHVYRLQ